MADFEDLALCDLHDAIKTKQPERDSGQLLSECLEIIVACCKYIKNSLGVR